MPFLLLECGRAINSADSPFQWSGSVISSRGFWNVCFQLSGMDWGLCVGLPVEVMAVPAMEFGPLHLVQLEAGAGSCGTVVLTSHCCVGK